MLHALIYHGFPIDTLVGRIERNMLHSIANQIDKKFADEKNLLINGTWMNWDFQYTVQDLMQHYHPDNVFIASLVDPWFRSMDQWAYNKFPDSKIYFFGNVDNDLHFNMLSIYCNQVFPSYQSNELTLSSTADKIFLCYQNKKNRYRDAITKELIDRKLVDDGYLTYWYKKLGPRELDEEEKNSLRKMNLSPDRTNLSPDSIGSLTIWNDCLVNIVSETDHDPNQHVFISEKTWKPIIGLRPFMINGDPMIYDRLKKYGFETFDRWFPVDELVTSTSESTTAGIIARVIQDLKDQQVSLQDLYLDMKPDIEHNRNRFFEFVQEQQHKIDTLFD